MTKTQTRRSDATATASDRGRKKPTRAVTDGDVARRAYDLYVARGREDGHDVDDWLAAERELRGTSER